MNYPDADRYIPATDAMITGWNGPILLPMPSSGRLACFTWCGSPVNDCEGVLDPMREEVRDHLIRRLSLPGWMRDGAGLEPWQSAGLIACAAAEHAPPRLARLLGAWAPWTRRRFTVERHESETAERRQVPVGSGFPSIYVSSDGWQTPDPIMGRASGTETGDPGKLAADTAALAHGCALMLDADSMVLPWPSGARVWRRT